MSETLMNKLRALCERITDYVGNGGGWNPEAMEHDKVRDLLMDCRTELRAILPDAERLEIEIANLKAHREEFEKTNGELTDYAYLCKLEGQVERLEAALECIQYLSDGSDCNARDMYRVRQVSLAALFDQPVAPKETK